MKVSSENKDDILKEESVRKQAEAIIELFKTMPESIQEEIRTKINEQSIEYRYPGKEDTEQVSEPSLDEIWLSPENDHWDKFFQKR